MLSANKLDRNGAEPGTRKPGRNETDPLQGDNIEQTGKTEKEEIPKGMFTAQYVIGHSMQADTD